MSALRCRRAVLVIAVLLVSLGALVPVLNTSKAFAATNSYLNFQGRLLSNTGALVADGTYNIQFNLYTVASGGSTQWTETYLNTTTPVTLKNGYFSVQLGSLTAFPSTINWDQQQWLGMTVRGTGSCAFGACTPTDAEMTPRFALTAVPLAFSANQLQKTSGANVLKVVTATPTATVTYTFADAAAGNYNVCTTVGNCFGSGSGSTLQAAYDAGNTISTSNARDISFTLADTATDSNFLVNVATGSTGRFAVQSNSSDVLSVTGARIATFSGANTGQFVFNSSLAGGARAGATPLVSISQPNDATNNSSSVLLDVTNSDTATAQAVVNITQSSTGAANALTITTSSTTGAISLVVPSAGKGLIVTGVTSGTGIDLNTVTTSAGGAISATGLTSGSALVAGAALTTGSVINAQLSSTSMTTGKVINIYGTPTGALSAFTGALINVSTSRQYTGAGTVTDTGNYLNISRTSANSGAGTFTQSGDLVSFYSQCVIVSGSCNDSGNILELNQGTIGTTGDVLNVLNSGTGNLATFDGSNASANGVSIDIQSASTQFALKVTSNNGATNSLEVDGNGNVTIGAGGGTFSLQTSNIDISTAGVITGATAITSSGTITFTGLASAGIVTNTSGGVLGTVATIPVANGGTNIASYAVGDLLYASNTTVLSKLADVATGSCLISGGVVTAPLWGTCTAGNTLQTAYNNSTSPEITLAAGNGAVTIRDNSTPIGANLLEVQNNGGGTTYLAVSATATSITGGLSQSAGAVSLAGNAASSVTTTSGALTLTSAAATTWSTAAGTLTLQGFGGTIINTPTATASSAISVTSGTASAGTSGTLSLTTGSGTTGTGATTIGTGDASAGTAGNITIDNGTSSTGTPQINIGSSANARAITIGNSSVPSTVTVQGGTGSTAVVIQAAAAGSVIIGSSSVANTAVFNANVVGANVATATTGTSSGVGATNTTTITLVAAGSFANGDVILVDNTGGSGQDYYTRITAGGGTTTLTVDVPVSWGTAAGYTGNAAITKYTVQNIGAANTGTSFSDSARFFQGFFLGGIRTGAGSTSLSDQNLTSTQALYLNTGGQNTRLYVSSTGNVGIGNLNNTYKLDVTGDINTSTGFRVGGTAGATTTCSGGNFLQNQVVTGGITTGGTCVAAGTGTVTGSGSAGQVPYWTSASALSGNANFIWDNTNGRLGVGYAAPNNKLSVNGNASFGLTDNAFVGPAQFGGLDFPRGEILFSNTNAQNQLYLMSNGYGNAGGTLNYRNTAVSATIALDNGAISLMTDPSGTLNTALPLNTRLYVANSGNVGIGNTSPSGKLNVSIASTATLTNVTQALTSSSNLVTSDYTNGNYVAGLTWSASNDNVTKPKAGIYLQETGSGSTMIFGTSNSYATGITNAALTLDPTGNAAVAGSLSVYQGTASSGFPIYVKQTSVNQYATVESTGNFEAMYRTMNANGIWYQGMRNNVTDDVAAWHLYSSVAATDVLRVNTGGDLIMYNKEVLKSSDSYLRINQSLGFSNGIWLGSSPLKTGDSFYLGSNGGTGTSRVAIYGGSYNGSNVITLNGGDGSGWFNGSLAANNYAMYSYFQGGEGQVLRLSGSNGVNMHIENLNGTVRFVNSPWTAGLWSVDQSGNEWANGTITAGSSFVMGAATLRQSSTSGIAYFNSGGLRINGSLSLNGNINVTSLPAQSQGPVCFNGTGVGDPDLGTVYNFGNCASLRKYKDDIVDLPYGLDTIRQLRPVQYRWNIDDKKLDTGFVAEDVEAINPIFAEYMGGKLTGVNYMHMVSLAIKGVQILDAQQQTMQNDLDTLEAGNFSGDLHVGGDAFVQGGLTVQGTTALAKLIVAGDTEVQKLTINGKIITGGDAPAVALGTAAGDALTASGTVTGNDTAGTLTITTGASGTVGGQVLGAVTFHTPYTQVPVITVTPTSEDAAGIHFFLVKTATGWSIKVLDAPGAGKTYSFDYHVIQ